jgi:hypothetical protein
MNNTDVMDLLMILFTPLLPLLWVAKLGYGSTNETIMSFTVIYISVVAIILNVLVMTRK